MWTHKHKKVDEGGKGAVCSLHEIEKLREPEEKKELAQTLKTFLCQTKKERIRSMYNKTIIRFGFCDIQNNQGLGKGYQP